MDVHLVQPDISWEEPERTGERLQDLLAQGVIRPGSMVVLPEMCLTGFSMNLSACLDQGVSRRFLHHLSTTLDSLVIGGLAVATDGSGERGSNRLLAVGPEGGVTRELCEYVKVHPFRPGGEAERFEAGREVRVFGWSAKGHASAGAGAGSGAGSGAEGGVGAVVCPAICYDLRFPELFRVGAMRGATVFVVIANWPAARASHWRALLIARAIENQAFVIGVNRVGEDPHVAYAGGSMVVDPRGEVLLEMGAGEGVGVVTIDPAEAVAWRGAFPALADARLLGGLAGLEGCEPVR